MNRKGKPEPSDPSILQEVTLSLARVRVLRGREYILKRMNE